MLFNSLLFLLFFPIVTVLYWTLPHKVRNPFLLIASYYFYMNWEPAYALLIIFSTITTWLFSFKITSSQDEKKRKFFLIACLTCNLAILFTFKYLNFFTETIYSFLSVCGIRMNVPHFNLLLPVGISFYTFQAIGYTIDIFKKKIPIEKNFFTYALFVSFFPQLVAGPIERAKNLLPQFHTKHFFNSDMFIEGIKMIIWGYFMKLCIAENVSTYVDAVYNNLINHSGYSIILATFFFTFQIFCDFGGYSLIAIGCAKCMGFTLMQNFNHPYLSSSFREFWKRWHISLSSWFMDYVYIPLGGSRCSELKHQRNLLLTMLASGLWHGANWTFIFWGGVHGVLLCINSLSRKVNFLQSENIVIKVFNILFTFILTMFTWIFFRANTIGDAFLVIKKIASPSGHIYYGDGKPSVLLPFILILILIFKEIKDEYFKNSLKFMHHPNIYISAFYSAIIIITILLCAQFEGGQFIYFQF